MYRQQEHRNSPPQYPSRPILSRTSTAHIAINNKAANPYFNKAANSTASHKAPLTRRPTFFVNSLGFNGAAMDSVLIPSETVPAELKACEQILKRAKELKKAEPVVSYWCEYKRSHHGCLSKS